MLGMTNMKSIKIHNWLGIKNNLAIATFYLSIIGGAWVVFTYFYPISTDKTSHNSNTLTGNTFNNSTVKIEQNILTGYSIEQHEKSLKDRETSLRTDLELAHDADKSSILLQLATVEKDRINIQKSYEDTKAENQKLNLALNELKSKNPKIAAQQFIDAQSALQNGDTSKADAVFKDIENASEETIANAAKAAYQRARIANNAFRWNDALELANKAHRLQPKNGEYISFYASLLLRSGDAILAQNLFEQSLQITIEKYGAVSVEAAKQHSWLAEAYKINNVDLAESHGLKAIEIAKLPHKVASIDNLFLGNLYSNLAVVYQENKKYPEAESNHLKAIALHEKALPANHPDLSIDYNNLGGLYGLQNKLNEAAIYLQKAVDIDEKVLPLGHPSLPRHYVNLAQIYMDKGSNPINKPTLLKAKQILLKAIALFEKYPPPDKGIIGVAYFNLAYTYSFLGDFKAAEPYFKKAADIAFRNYGVKDNRTIMAIQGYIVCLKNQNKNIGTVLEKYGMGVRPVNAF
jgi:tetratricopeptide (TPR) repeat protein